MLVHLATSGCSKAQKVHWQKVLFGFFGRKLFPICLLQCAAVVAHYGQVVSVGRDLLRLAFLSSLTPAETDPINLNTDPINLNKKRCPLSHTYQAQLLKQKMERSPSRNFADFPKLDETSEVRKKFLMFFVSLMFWKWSLIWPDVQSFVRPCTVSFVRFLISWISWSTISKKKLHSLQCPSIGPMGTFLHHPGPGGLKITAASSPSLQTDGFVKRRCLNSEAKSNASGRLWLHNTFPSKKIPYANKNDIARVCACVLADQLRKTNVCYI